MIIGPLKLKAQFPLGDDMAIGPGKADLLEAIDAHGSIAAAGRSMGMSYRRSWMLVDSMNRCWSSPLVEASPGGGPGRGARLTQTGRTVLRHYRALELALATTARTNGDLAALAALLADRPR